MFEKASRIKLRFPTTKGNLTVEDLWDLPLVEGGILDNLALSLEDALKEAPEKSFVVKKRTVNEDLELSFDIVKHTIKTKKAEKKIAMHATNDKEQDEKILGLISAQEDKNLSALPIKELKKLLSKNNK
ncbi:MAG: hypothetical protein KAS32_30915 [Candidatus Peribacteraceae bacterium]|nr:hypothetical protein [Candidatus Peribacteraceae bacterium]